MSKARFDIIAAVLNAYRFLGREWRYLAGVAILPAGVNLASVLFVQFLRPEAGIVEQFLWSLPATTVVGWFMFVETRLLVLGERIHHLPDEAAFSLERQQALRASVIVWILFNMASMGLFAYLLWSGSEGISRSKPGAGAIGVILIAFSFWAIRFSVAHILAAVGYSIRQFIYRVNGAEFSLRLIGLGLLCILPIFFMLHMLGFILPLEGDLDAALFTAVAAFSVTVSIGMTALLTAAAGFALKEVLGRPEGRERAA